MIPIQDNGREFTCPSCKKDLHLSDGWVLQFLGFPSECARCGSQQENSDKPYDDLVCADCLEKEAYYASDDYRALAERRDALQADDVLAALDAANGGLMQASRNLGVLRGGPYEGRDEARWLRKWLQTHSLLPALYDIRRKHGWTGDPPHKRPRKRPAPVLAFKATNPPATIAKR